MAESIPTVPANNHWTRLFVSQSGDVDVPAGIEQVPLSALLDVIKAEYRDAAAEAVNAGNQSLILAEQIGTGPAILAVEPWGGGVLCELIPLQRLSVPAGISKRMLGVRREAVHDLCNDLSVVCQCDLH